MKVLYVWLNCYRYHEDTIMYALSAQPLRLSEVTRVLIFIKMSIFICCYKICWCSIRMEHFLLTRSMEQQLCKGQLESSYRQRRYRKRCPIRSQLSWKRLRYRIYSSNLERTIRLPSFSPWTNVCIRPWQVDVLLQRVQHHLSD